MSHNSNLSTLLPYSHLSKHILHLKQRLVFHKTTCHFLKTTACFTQNDVSLFENDGLFYTKQRVVFYEHSETAKVLPVIENSFDSLIGDNKIQIVKKSIFNLFARTRTRTVLEFLHFCCHKCHTITHNTLMDRQLRTFLRYISTMRLFNYQIFDDKTEINTLFPPSFMRNTLLSSLIFHLECDTCDSKKTTSLLEGARYAYARERSARSFHLDFNFS